MIKLINPDKPAFLSQDNDLLITLTKKDFSGDFEISFIGYNEVHIPCLYVDENTSYIDLDLFQDGVYATLLSSKLTQFTFSQDFNGSIESLIRLFLIDKKIMSTKNHSDKVINIKLTPEKRMDFFKIEKAIKTLKSQDIKALKSAMYKGILTNVFEKVLEKTDKNISQIYKGKTLVICDTHNIYHRLYHAVDPIFNSSGENMGLVPAFRYFLPNLFNFNPDFILFTDEGQNKIRKELFMEYKANRSETPDDLKKSIKICNSIITSLGFKIESSEDFEADDTIASFTKEFVKYGGKVIIFSTDKDLYQLIGENVSMYNHFKKTFISKEIMNKYFPDLEPSQVRDSLALQGDTSDNIPGVAGIGKVTASKLLNEYGDIDSIIANIPSMKKSVRKDKLEKGISDLLLSRDLTTLYDCLAQDKEFESLRVPDNLFLAPTIVETITQDALS